MKKLFAIIAALVATTFAFNAKAQLSSIEGMPPYKLGVTVGMNMPWMSGSMSVAIDDPVTGVPFNASSDYSSKFGFQVGANLMVDASPVIPNTFARVEVKYMMKGAEAYVHAAQQEEKITTHYIEMPVHYGYAFYINDNLTLMAETGPYFAFGIYGNNEFSSKSKSYNLSVFEKVQGGNRFDLGWGVQASAMIAKNYQIHVAYDYGFINITKDFLQNRNLSVGFTWFFESLFE